MSLIALCAVVCPGETTHLELDPISMLSEIATFTPYSDFNQSPRNMYQVGDGRVSLLSCFQPGN